MTCPAGSNKVMDGWMEWMEVVALCTPVGFFHTEWMIMSEVMFTEALSGRRCTLQQKWRCCPHTFGHVVSTTRKNLKSQMKYHPSLAQLKCSIAPRLSFCKVLLVVKQDRWKETFKSSSAAFRLIKRVCCERSQTVSSVLYFQDAQSANEWTGRTYSTHTRAHTHTRRHANQLGLTLLQPTSPAGLFAEEYQTSCSLSFFPIRGSGLHYCRPAGCEASNTQRQKDGQTDRQADIKVQALKLISYNLCWRLKHINHGELGSVHPSVCPSPWCVGAACWLAVRQFVSSSVCPERARRIFYYNFCNIINITATKTWEGRKYNWNLDDLSCDCSGR